MSTITDVVSVATVYHTEGGDVLKWREDQNKHPSTPFTILLFYVATESSANGTKKVLHILTETEESVSQLQTHGSDGTISVLVIVSPKQKTGEWKDPSEADFTVVEPRLPTQLLSRHVKPMFPLNLPPPEKYASVTGIDADAMLTEWTAHALPEVKRLQSVNSLSLISSSSAMSVIEVWFKVHAEATALCDALEHPAVKNAEAKLETSGRDVTAPQQWAYVKATSRIVLQKAADRCSFLHLLMRPMQMILNCASDDLETMGKIMNTSFPSFLYVLVAVALSMPKRSALEGMEIAQLVSLLTTGIVAKIERHLNLVPDVEKVELKPEAALQLATKFEKCESILSSCCAAWSHVCGVSKATYPHMNVMTDMVDAKRALHNIQYAADRCKELSEMLRQCVAEYPDEKVERESVPRHVLVCIERFTGLFRALQLVMSKRPLLQPYTAPTWEALSSYFHSTRNALGHVPEPFELQNITDLEESKAPFWWTDSGSSKSNMKIITKAALPVSSEAQEILSNRVGVLTEQLEDAHATIAYMQKEIDRLRMLLEQKKEE